MCKKATCPTCRKSHYVEAASSVLVCHVADKLSYTTEKVTWWGCGNHVSMVMDSYPKDQWCSCTPTVEADGKEYPPMGKQADSL